jgi:hypothetical protein
MIHIIVVPADLVRLSEFFKHLFEIVKKTYPTVDTAEIKLSKPENKDEQKHSVSKRDRKQL